MSFEAAKESVIAFVREHIAFAEPVVAAMGFAEGIPGLSLLVPSSPLFLGIGAVHSAAGGSFWNLWLAASAGAVAGDCLVYGLARHYKDGIQNIPMFRRQYEWRKRGHEIFAKWGVFAVVGGKFLGFMRPFVPAMAGILNMPFHHFLPASIVSSLAWAGAFLAPGYGIRFLLG